MKRFFLAATLSLLLCGCTPELPEQTVLQTSAAPTAETSIPREDPGRYVPDSEAEKQTSGAVKAYTVTGENILDVQVMGDRLLVFSSCDTGMQATVLTGDHCSVHACRLLSGCVSTQPGMLRSAEDRLAYYDAGNRCVVLLNVDLQETERILLPETATGSPVISEDLSTVFYCSGDRIHAMDLLTGISRLVCQYSSQQLELKGSFFEDSILQCQIVEGAQSFTCFLSTETGQELGKDTGLLEFHPWGDRLFLIREEGYLPEYLIGSRTGELQSLHPLEQTLIEALSLNAILGISCGENGLSAALYDADTGLRAAAVELSGITGFFDAAVDPRGYVWLYAFDQQAGQEMLYRWDPALSPAEGTEVYLDLRYTRENPDKAGLAACQDRAQALAGQYGVHISLGEDMPLPEDDVLTMEFRADALNAGLDQLEKALASYPLGFLTTVVEDTSSGVLSICLVRDISQDEDGLQYWVGRDACIALKLGEQLEQSFHHQLSHVLDNFIIANCYAYDDWEELNPEGADYDYSYARYSTRQDRTWLEGENQAFVDSYAMTYPREDRARILEYAMMPGNAEKFRSEYMQAKLQKLCLGIRESFGWKRSPETFPWEQYLNTSLAYTK